MHATSFLAGKQEPRPDLRSEACEGGKERMQFRSMHLGPFKNQRSGLALLVSRAVSAWRSRMSPRALPRRRRVYRLGSLCKSSSARQAYHLGKAMPKRRCPVVVRTRIL